MINNKCLRFFGFLRNKISQSIVKLETGQLHLKASNLKVNTYALVFGTFLFWTSILNYRKIANPVLAISLIKKKIEEIAVDTYTLLIDKADRLYDQMQFQELYELLIHAKDDKNDEILWRLARVLYRLSKANDSKESKIAALSEANDYVFQALELNETNFASHKWASIIVVELAEYHGTKAKLQQSYISKKHMMRAHELNPKDGTTLYLLGVWCFTFADLTWTQRKLAAVLFATPPTSSYYEAYTFFAKAEEADPGFYSMNLLMLGKTSMKMGDSERAVDYLKKARDYPQKTEDDEEAHREAVQILNQLGIN